MCRERTKRKQEDQQHMDNPMADFGSSDSYFQPTLAQRHRSSSFSSIIGLSVGLSNKGQSDSKFLPNLTSSFSFRSQKSSSPNGSFRRWDCSKLGLSIINSLVNETESFIEAFESSKGKNIVIAPLGSKVYIRKPSTRFLEPLVPQDSGISSNAELGIEVPLKREPFRGIPSDLLYPCKPSPSISVCTQNTNPSFKSSSPDNGLTKHSGFVGSLSQSEMKLSEDYTCIISHGPNPKTTHIFGDCILDEAKLPQSTDCSYVSKSHPSDGFLSFCYSCKKELEQGKDIYMYRGEKAFCSTECRSKEILLEEEREKSTNNCSELL